MARQARPRLRIPQQPQPHLRRLRRGNASVRTHCSPSKTASQTRRQTSLHLRVGRGRRNLPERTPRRCRQPHRIPSRQRHGSLRNRHRQLEHEKAPAGQGVTTRRGPLVFAHTTHPERSIAHATLSQKLRLLQCVNPSMQPLMLSHRSLPQRIHTPRQILHITPQHVHADLRTGIHTLPRLTLPLVRLRMRRPPLLRPRLRLINRELHTRQGITHTIQIIPKIRLMRVVHLHRRRLSSRRRPLNPILRLLMHSFQLGDPPIQTDTAQRQQPQQRRNHRRMKVRVRQQFLPESHRASSQLYSAGSRFPGRGPELIARSSPSRIPDGFNALNAVCPAIATVRSTPATACHLSG
nr:MAG TPA: hypothetical protein [Caudoviricetes sp.]